jgi:hypothetical protein
MVYNQYLNVAADAAYDALFEPQQTLFRRLYATRWLTWKTMLSLGPRRTAKKPMNGTRLGIVQRAS